MVKKKQARRRPEPVERLLQYKVVELSTVDEGSVERTVNEWVAEGWTFDGLQFAMRESSKRPAMAFVFFTRQVARAEGQRTREDDRYRPDADAERHLRRLVVGPETPEAGERAPVDAWTRLEQLAGEEDG